MYKLLARQRIEKFAKEKREERIKKLKELIKKEPEYIELCKEYGKPLSFINDIPISFSKDIDVSAKTVNEEIFLNDQLFFEPIEKQLRYIIHEATHCQQQAANEVDFSNDKKDYLDDPNEQEAFGKQISFMLHEENLPDITEYIEQLLDHHNIKGKERKEKIKKLLENV